MLCYVCMYAYHLPPTTEWKLSYVKLCALESFRPWVPKYFRTIAVFKSFLSKRPKSHRCELVTSAAFFFVVTLAWRGHWGVGSTSLAGDGFLVILEVTQGHQGRSEQQTMATPVFKSKNDTVKTWRQQNQQGLSAPHKFPVHGSEFMEAWCADSWGSVGPHSIW